MYPYTIVSCQLDQSLAAMVFPFLNLSTQIWVFLKNLKNLKREKEPLSCFTNYVEITAHLLLFTLTCAMQMQKQKRVVSMPDCATEIDLCCRSQALGINIDINSAGFVYVRSFRPVDQGTFN